MICKVCQAFMLCHPSLIKHQKCPTCGFTCPDPEKESTKLDKENHKFTLSKEVKRF